MSGSGGGPRGGRADLDEPVGGEALALTPLSRLSIHLQPPPLPPHHPLHNCPAWRHLRVGMIIETWNQKPFNFIIGTWKQTVHPRS